MADIKKKLFRRFHFIIDPFCYWGARLCMKALRLVNKDYRHSWLVSENARGARDNGYFFFRYLRKTRPDIHAWFLIGPESQDYEKVAALGKTVKPGSFMHYLLFAGSDMLVSTHVYGYIPKGVFHALDRDWGLIRSKKVYLKHGIIKDKLEFAYADNCRLDLFVCGAKPEWEAMVKESGYPANVVRYLGLCRYDTLLQPHEVKPQLLVMPTWRHEQEGMRPEDFVKTHFYKAFQELLNSEKLHQLTEKHGLKLIFYPHMVTQHLLECFSSPWFTLAPQKDYDVQPLLMESQCLVTDFSSVFFDFAYMGKPEVFFQFDQAEYRSAHYKEGYFSYENDGFGPVTTTLEEMIRALSRELDAGGSEMYKERTNRFFAIRDTNNCRRNLDAALSLLDGAKEEK